MATFAAPSAELREAWAEAAKRQSLPPKKRSAYTSRWTSLWRKVRKEAASRPGWSDSHVWLVNDYVEARRQAYDHQRAAELDPYPSGAGSRPFPHPGFERAAAARREAREVLADLLLTPRAFDAADAVAVGANGSAPDDAPRLDDQDGL